MTKGAFRRGEVVEVRSAAEILQALDSTGATDSLPFMPEMVEFCGRRVTVDSRASKVCDTVTSDLTSRRLPNAVLLTDLRCSGSGHDGCQSECLLYWNEAWLRRPGEVSGAGDGDDAAATAALLELAKKNAVEDGADERVRYRCQATRLVAASERVSTSDPRAYVKELTSGNVTFRRFVKVMARASVMQPLHSVGRLDEIPLAGPSEKSPPRQPPLNLRPGEWVRGSSMSTTRR
jgi:hypothetical protein